MASLTCIMCPVGCEIEYEKKGNEMGFSGYACKRGLLYAQKEVVSPERVVTSLVPLENGKVVSCKTDGLIPKNLIFNVLKEIKKLKHTLPVKEGDILIENVLDTNVNIVATSSRAKC